MVTQPLVVLTGAGVSADSGIPTFRGDGGLWRSHRAQDLATPAAFRRDPILVWQFYSWRREVLHGCEPNSAHLILAEIEAQFDQFALITQNIDGLHEAAGSEAVLELHGALNRTRCSQCGEDWSDSAIHLEGPPTCPVCTGPGRPDVVWFGEPLPADIIERAFELCSQARTMLVVGTSAVVNPAAQLPLVAKQAGAHLVEFNLEATPVTPYADETHFGPASETLEAWWEGVRS